MLRIRARRPRIILFLVFLAGLLTSITIVVAYLSARDSAQNLPVKSALVDQTSLSKAVARLDLYPRAPWTLTVIGDSTGAGPGRWVTILAAALSKKYDRPVILHEWSEGFAEYSTETKIGSGRNAPIIIWNGSAPGKTFGYASTYIGELMPGKSDVAILNYGHNCLTIDCAVAGASKLIGQVRAHASGRLAIAIVLQNPRLDDTHAIQDKIVAALRLASSSWRNVEDIDVYRAFRPDVLWRYLDADGRHPNGRGSALWARVVETKLGFS